MTVKKGLFYAGVFLVAFGVTRLFVGNSPDITKNAVMITNKAENSGGTGIVYYSTKNGSYVLTNAHVCHVVENGGVIKTDAASYQVQSYLKSEVSDLCMIYTPVDLKRQTKLAKSEPELFTLSKVSGHPALMPTVVSLGHFSGRQIISVMTGTRACTDADKDNAFCLFFGIIPIIKSYDSQLVTSTIMPGSSGSGVYNAKNQLSGVVFAGQGDFGYGWIVPYDQVVQFLSKEVFSGNWVNIDQTLTKQNTDAGSGTKEMLKKCNQAVELNIVRFCSILRRDVVWNEQ
jgi:S1-C subfamily serine protease